MKVCCWLVVYHGHTGRFIIVWANGKQNSAPVNFVPESRLPFVLISSIYRKTAAKAWNSCQRTGFEEMGREFPCGKTGLPFRMYRCPRKCSAGKTQNVVFRLLSNRKPFVKGNERYLLWAVWSNKAQMHHQ